MLSQAQINANRENAKKSSGPRSETGKSASSRNGLTHGLSAKKHIIPAEDDAEFDALLADLNARFRPVGIGEEKLVLLIAADQWRLDRAIPYEAGILIGYLEMVDTCDFQAMERLANQRRNNQNYPGKFPLAPDPPDPAHRLSRAFAEDAGHKNLLGRLNRYQAALQRNIDRSLRQLKIYQEARKAAAAADAAEAGSAPAQPAAPSPQPSAPRVATERCKANPIHEPNPSFPVPSAESDPGAQPPQSGSPLGGPDA